LDDFIGQVAFCRPTMQAFAKEQSHNLGRSMLIALRDGERVEAALVERGPLYVCPGCKRGVVLRKGTRITHNFAHKPPVSCSWATGETQAHLAAKKAFRDAFKARGLRAELEKEVISLAGDRRADVLIWSPAGAQVAFEIQHQPIDPRDIRRRTEAYCAAGIPVVWVSLPKKDVWEHLATNKSGLKVISRYSARDWENWVHGYNFKKLWLYNACDGTMWRGTLSAYYIEVEETSWHDESGHEQSAGGYSKKSKRWKELNLTGPFKIEDLRIKLGRRRAFQTREFSFPAGPTAGLLGPDET
jgi:competence protein CoiA